MLHSVRRFKSNVSQFPRLTSDKFVLHNSSCAQPFPYHCSRQIRMDVFATNNNQRLDTVITSGAV